MKPIHGALNVSRWFLESVPVAVDFTCGNGHDTVALADLADKVYAFDVQAEAIASTKSRLGEAPHVRVIHDSFVNFPHYITEPIDLAVFNLGYLPGSDKQVVTRAEDVILCLQSLVIQLSQPSRVVIVAYPGHPEGRREVDALHHYLQSLDNTRFRTFSFVHLNGSNDPPQLFILETNAR